MSIARYGKHLSGSSSIGATATRRLDAYLFDANLEHYLAKGWGLGVLVPFGSIRIQPTGGSERIVSGAGDVQLSVSYDLSRLWRAKGYRPSLRVRPQLMLPTGEVSSVVDPDSEVPPNLVALGAGAFGLGADAQLTQPLSAKARLVGFAAFRRPLSYSQEDIRMGGALIGGLGADYRLSEHLTARAKVSALHRFKTRERGVGTIVKSGGDWLYAELGATFRVTHRLAVGLNGRIPIHSDVNGEQISESWSVGSFVALSFGGGKEEEHDHGDDDEHDHGDGHDDEHEGEHEEHGKAPVDDLDAGLPGDVSDLATGGESFSLEDAAIEGRLVVIDFWAEWCKPCKTIDKILREVAANHPEVAVRRVEVPTFESKVAREHLEGVSGLPVVWIVNGAGQVVKRLESVKPAELHELFKLELETK